jgi:hypothetical protein
MLNNLSGQVRQCHWHAERCAHQASLQTDPKLKENFLEMEERWLILASSCEFTERLDDFSNETKAAG